MPKKNNTTSDDASGLGHVVDPTPFLVKPGSKVSLRGFDPDSIGNFTSKKQAEEALSEDVKALAVAQDLLYASNTYSILIILQALDAAGKDGMIEHVMSGVNPQGCHVVSFKQPSQEELDHDFLWRCSKALPARGKIGIFNRSYYEEVLVVRVHPNILASQRIPDLKVGDELWRERYEDIVAFERHLRRNGTVILKFFLNISKEEQRQRFLARLDDEEKHWKFSTADLKERARWDDYMVAYEQMLGATSTDFAPWYVIPANKKRFARACVADIVTTQIVRLGLKYPVVDAEKRQELLLAKAQLESEASE